MGVFVSGCSGANQDKTESPSTEVASPTSTSEEPDKQPAQTIPDQNENKIGRRNRPTDDVDYDESPPDDDDPSSCKFSDGSHSATVSYHNPDTGFENEYTLDVVVEDCQVIEIDFPKGGWLDDTHIDPEELSEDGEADLTDDRGHEWTVQIDE